MAPARARAGEQQSRRHFGQLELVGTGWSAKTASTSALTCSEPGSIGVVPLGAPAGPSAKGSGGGVLDWLLSWSEHKGPRASPAALAMAAACTLAWRTAWRRAAAMTAEVLLSENEIPFTRKELPAARPAASMTGPALDSSAE